GVGPKVAERVVTELKDKAPALAAVDPAVVRLTGTVDDKGGPGPGTDAASGLGKRGDGHPQARAALARAGRDAARGAQRRARVRAGCGGGGVGRWRRGGGGYGAGPEGALEVSTPPRRLVSPERREEDADASLRPQRLAEFIGQEQARANLGIFIEAARARGEA